VGSVVYFSGFTTATFLNGQTATLTGVNNVLNTVTFSFTNANYGPTADNGVLYNESSAWNRAAVVRDWNQMGMDVRNNRPTSTGWAYGCEDDVAGGCNMVYSAGGNPGTAANIKWIVGANKLANCLEYGFFDNTTISGAAQNRLVLGESGCSSGNIYNVASALTHRFQVNAVDIFKISSTSFFPATAGVGDLGQTANPIGNLWLGTAATNNFKFQPPATAAARVITWTDPLANSNLPFTSNTDTTASHVLHATATAGLYMSSAIAVGDLPNLPLNDVISPTGAITPFADGNNPLIFNCALTSGTTCLTTGETTAATTAGAVEDQITTLNTSTAIPLQITQGAGVNATNAPTALNVVGGTGGANAGATSPGWKGAPIALTCGNGSNAGATSGTGGAGGDCTIQSGNGGTAAIGSTTGKAGDILLKLGTPGATGTAGQNGTVQVGGATAGLYFLTQGTAPTTANTDIPANSYFEYAPTGITAYNGAIPTAAPVIASYRQTDGCPSAACTYTFHPVPKLLTVASDFTDSTSATLGLITGLSTTMPVSQAVVVSFHCALLFDQATAVVSDSFGVGVTGTAPTNLNASGTAFTAAAVEATGTLVGLATTTPTAVVTFTPSVITTVWKAELDGTIEQPSNATPGVFGVYASTTTGTDNLIVKRGSYCSVIYQ
jgi:hypothetical protein